MSCRAPSRPRPRRAPSLAAWLLLVILLMPPASSADTREDVEEEALTLPAVMERFLPGERALEAGVLEEAPVLMPRHEFEELRRRLARSEASPPAPVRVALSPGAGTLHLEGPDRPARLVFTRAVRVVGVVGEPVPVPVAPQDAVVLEFQAGKPGEELAPRDLEALADGRLIWPAPTEGSWRLRMEVVIHPDRDGVFSLPQLPGPGGSVEPVLAEGAGHLERVGRSAGPVAHIDPSVATRIRLTRRAPPPSPSPAEVTAEPGPPPPASVSRPVVAWEVLAEIEHAAVRMHARAEIIQPGLGGDRLVIALPRAARVRSVEGPLVAGWDDTRAGPEGAESPEQQTFVRVRLRRKLRGRTELELGWEIPLARRIDHLSLVLPRLATALRERSFLAVAPLEATEIGADRATARELTPVPVEELPEALVARSRTPVLAAYRASGPRPRLMLPVEQLAAHQLPRLIVQGINGLTVIAPGEGADDRRRLSVVSKAVLKVENASARYLDLELPEGAEVLSCFVNRQPVAPLRDPTRPGRLRLPLPRSPRRGPRLEAIPVQLAYRNDREGAVSSHGELGVLLPVVHAHVAQTSWKVYTPEEMHVLGLDGDLEWLTEPSPFAGAEATNLFFEEVVMPLLWLGLLALLIGACELARRHDGLRGALSALLGLLWSRLAWLLAGGLGVMLLAAVAVPNFRAARERANVRACFANQKTIAGAIEMYNLDFNTSVDRLDRRLLEELRSQGYLQSIPSDPGYGPSSSDHYRLSPDGHGLVCSVHGSIRGGAGKASFYNRAEEDAGRPVGYRSSPVDVAIPVVGSEALLERGFLEGGARVGYRIHYLHRDTLARYHLAALLLGAALVLACLLTRLRSVGPTAVATAVVTGAVAFDTVEPAMAGWFLLGGVGVLALAAATSLARMAPELLAGLARYLSERSPSASAAAALLLAVVPVGHAGPAPLEVIRVHGVETAGSILVTPATYQRLASAREAAPAFARLPRPARVQEARVQVSAGSERPRVRLALSIRAGTGWLPVLPTQTGTRLVSARCGSQDWPLRRERDRWLAAPFDEDAELELVVETRRRRFAAGQQIRVPVPPAPRVAVRVEAPGAGAVFVDGRPHRDVTWLRPRQATVEVLLEKSSARAMAPVMKAPERRTELTARAYHVVELTDRGARARSLVELKVTGKPVQELELAIPAAWSPLEVRGPQLADWELREGATLALALAAPLSGEQRLELEFEVLRDRAEELALALPHLRGAAYQERHLYLAVPPEKILEPAELPEGIELIESSALPEGVARPSCEVQAAYRFDSPGDGAPPVLEARVRSLDAVAIQEGSVDVLRVESTLLADGRVVHQLSLQVKNGSRQFLRVELPEEAAVYSTRVGGRPVRAASGAEGEVLIPLERSRLVNGAAQPFPVELVLGQRTTGDPAAGFSLTLPTLDLPVGSLRWAVDHPKRTHLERVRTNAEQSARAMPVSFAEGSTSAGGETAPRLAVRGSGERVHLSRDLLRPTDPAVFLEARLAPDGGGRARRVLAFTLATLATLLLLAGLRGRPDELRIQRVSGGGAVLIVAMLSGGTGAAGPSLYAAMGVFDGWLLHLLGRAAWRDPAAT